MTPDMFAFCVLLMFFNFLPTKPFDLETNVPSLLNESEIEILQTELCRKCDCDIETKQIDCSGKKLQSIFSTDEWHILENSKIQFEIIKMEKNIIEEIAQLPNYPMKYLYLAFNDITKIANGAFENVTELTKLDLSHNKLTSDALQPDAFKGKFNSNQFEPLKNLTQLNLGYNKLHSLNGDLFEHTPNLQVLILSKNNFQFIDKSTTIALNSLRSLKTLDLSYLEISSLPESIFYDLKELETLILTGNLFRYLPKALTAVKSLKYLVLDENPFQSFEGENIFKSLNALRSLSISYLPDVVNIGPAAFSSLTNLTTLIATNNPKLTSIDELAFIGMTGVPDISDCTSLKELYLSNNNLSVLRRNWIQNWDRVLTLDIRFNPWICDCSNSWLIHSLLPRIYKSRPFLTQNINCGSPEKLKGSSLLSLEVANMVCENVNLPKNDHINFINLLVGILIGILLTFCCLIFYRHTFAIRNHNNLSESSVPYIRANF